MLEVTEVGNVFSLPSGFLFFSASHVLDEVSSVCSLKIQDLILINTSRRPYSLLAIASFVNLRSLSISPHNIGDDLVECIGTYVIKGWARVPITSNGTTRGQGMFRVVVMVVDVVDVVVVFLNETIF